MIRVKFEEKVGYKISDTEFEIIRLCYNYSSYSEQQFVQLWKKDSQCIISEVLRKISNNFNKCQRELEHRQDCAKRNSIELQMARNQIELLNDKVSKIYDSIYKTDYNSCKELQITISEFFDNKKIIIWKLRNNIQLSNEEIELIDNNINQ